MSKVDTREWKEFKVGELFDIHPTKAYKLTNAKLLDGGDYPVVVNSAFNNGRGGYTTNKPTEKGNIITFSDTVDANTIFYQEKDFVGYAHVQGLYPYGRFQDKWNKKTLQFFCSCFRKSAFTYGFDYGNKFRRDIAIELNVLLPIDREGNPDRVYMESYMKNIEEKCKKELELLKKGKETEKSKIDTNLWKEFKVGELLQMQHQIELSPIDAFNNNMPNDITYPFYGQSSENNGIIDFYYLGENLLNNKDSDHCIMIHSNTHLAYHVNTPFYLKDGHGATTIFTNDNLNKFSVLFLIAVLNKTMDRLFDYDIKATKEKLKNLIVKLPVDSEGNPNRAYMESYMKNLMEKNQKKLQSLH